MLLQRIVPSAVPAAGDVVPVAVADPGLLKSLEPHVARRLRHILVSDVIRLEPDEPVDASPAPPDALGLLVLDGVLIRRVSVDDRSGIEVLGRGDVVRSWREEHVSASLAQSVTWQVMTPARLAVLDGEFSVIAARHPSILAELASRFVDRSNALAERLAIAQIPRLESRLLALLWHLADRWGHRHDGRLTIPLRLCHDTLAELACAEGPAVSLALHNLMAAGRIAPQADGGWALFGTPATADGVPSTRERRLPSAVS